MYRSSVVARQEHQHARSLWIAGIVFNHSRIGQCGDNFTDQYAVLGKFVVSVIGYAELTAGDKLPDSPKCRTDERIISFKDSGTQDERLK